MRPARNLRPCLRTMIFPSSSRETTRGSRLKNLRKRSLARRRFQIDAGLLSAALRCMRLFPRDPLVHVALQDVQRQWTTAKNHVVTFLEVKSTAKLLARVGAQLLDLHLAYLVGQRLSRPGNVAVDFVHDVQLRLGSVVHEVTYGLVALPVFGRHAGIHTQPP